MKTTLIFLELVFLFPTLIVKYLIWYLLLKYINATDTIWFLFYLYVPLGLFGSIVTSLASKAVREDKS